MPILNTTVNVSWINKPHSIDEIDTTVPDPREIKKYPPLPSSPTRWEKGSQSLPSMKKRISHSKRKSFSCVATTNNNNNIKKLDFFLHRPRSFHASFPLPPLPPPSSPFIYNKDDENDDDDDSKPLPAVPIDPQSQSSFSSSSPLSSPHSSSILSLSSPSSTDKKHPKQHYADFEPLTLKDITLILDRNDRMMAYNTAYEKCIATTSPLVNLLKTLKKKPPCPVHHVDVPPPIPSHASGTTSGTCLPRRSLTLPSLPSRITKKVAHLQHQFSMTDMI
ncbi:unnamed protein product [Absidia cylindrospora]